MALEEQQAEIRKLAEQNRALKKVQRLKRAGHPIPKALLAQAIGRIQFKSAGQVRSK